MLSFAACPLLTPKKHGISVCFQPACTERTALFTGNTAETTDSGSVFLMSGYRQMTHKPLHFHTAGAGVCPDRTAFRGVPMSAEPLSSPASGAFRCSSRWLRSSRKTVLPIPCCPDACSSSVSPPVSAWKKAVLFSGCRLWWLFLELPRQRSGSPKQLFLCI